MRQLRESIDWASHIQAVPPLAELPAPARAQTRFLKLPAGALLFARNEEPAALHVVLDGELRLVRHSIAGEEIVLQRTRRGFFAEASLDQPAYHCDADAVLDSSLLAIPLTAFKRALDDKAFCSTWLRHLASELRRVRAQNERLNLRRAEDRILHFMDAESTDGIFVLAGTRKDWAAELGLTHEALYRALARLEQKGVLAVASGWIRLTAAARKRHPSVPSRRRERC